MTGKVRPQAFIDVTGGTATFRAPGSDQSSVLSVDRGEDPRESALRRTVWEARRLKEPIELVTSGDHGEHRIVVSPDGALTPGHAGQDIDAFTETTPRSALGLPRDLIGPPPAEPKSTTTPTGRRDPRPSFIPTEPAHVPAGLAATLTRWGVPIKPTRAQVQRQEDVRTVSRHWGGCRVVAVANGKGGVGKTMTSAMLAAVFARHGGGGVLAWDNNDTRGTLGWRTEPSRHDATVQDALAAVPDLLDPSAGAGDIASYVHHQTADQYDVLRSNPQLLAASQRLVRGDFDRLLQVATRYYRLVVFDSGNDESAPRWLRMIDSADQLVVPTLAAPESAESAALLLEALTDRDAASARLARDAVVVVTQAERGSAAESRQIADAFTGLVRAVAVIPFDPALKSGPLRFESLRPVTRRAWVAAGAAVATGLH